MDASLGAVLAKTWNALSADRRALREAESPKLASWFVAGVGWDTGDPLGTSMMPKLRQRSTQLL